MNSVIVIEEIMDRWLENQPEPTRYSVSVKDFQKFQALKQRKLYN